MTKKIFAINYLYLASLVIIISCTSLVKTPDVADVSFEKAMMHWNRVLSKHVNNLGQVNFKAVAENPQDLKIFVSFISKNGPKSHPELFPNKEAKIAFYIDSYNALSMYNILDSEIPETLSGLKKVKFFFFKDFTIDGEQMSLYQYENNIIRRQDEERVHFALNCMSAGCPVLPQKAFEGKTLNQELDKLASFFFSELRNARIDLEHNEVYFSEILSFYTEDFLKKSPTLIDYANRYRTASSKIPAGLKIKYTPYDWTVNAQKPKVVGLSSF